MDIDFRFMFILGFLDSYIDLTIILTVCHLHNASSFHKHLFPQGEHNRSQSRSNYKDQTSEPSFEVLKFCRGILQT